MKYNIIIIMFVVSSTWCHDIMHFFNVPAVCSAPHTERFPLSIAQGVFRKGSTAHSFNDLGQKTALFDLYGFSKLSALGLNCKLNNTNVYSIALAQLASLPDLETFGTISIGGCFRLEEYYINISNSFAQGFFCSLDIPIRHAQLSNIQIKDSFDLSNFDARYTIPWHNISKNISSFFDYYGIIVDDYHLTSFGDMSCTLGWSHSDYHTHYIDYIDTELNIAVVLPTSKSIDANHPLSFSLGYNSHYGLACSAAFEIGYLDWISFNMRLDTLFLASQQKELRLKTDIHQKGVIFLCTQKVSVHPGTLINYACSLKADHIAKGISLSGEYAMTIQQSTQLCLNNTLLKKLSKTDNRFKGWLRHSIRVGMEYDHNTASHQSYPIICLDYRWTLKGRRVFDNAMWQATLSVYTTWNC